MYSGKRGEKNSDLEATPGAVYCSGNILNPGYVRARWISIPSEFLSSYSSSSREKTGRTALHMSVYGFLYYTLWCIAIHTPLYNVMLLINKYGLSPWISTSLCTALCITQTLPLENGRARSRWKEGSSCSGFEGSKRTTLFRIDHIVLFGYVWTLLTRMLLQLQTHLRSGKLVVEDGRCCAEQLDKTHL